MAVKGAYKVGKIRIDNEEAILASAEREFASRGFIGASMNRIAQGANLPRTNVHYYFKSKQDLYAKVLTDIVELWNDSFPEIGPGDDPGDAIEAYIRAKIAYSQTKPLASKIFASEILRGAPVLSSYLEDNYRGWLREKTRVIKSWIKQGKMDPVDPFYLIFMIWSTTQHYADFDVQVKTALGKHALNARNFEAIADNITHIILKGCGIERRKSYLG